MVKIHPPEIKRVYSFDFIRILATFMVIMIHTSGTFISSQNSGVFAFTVANFLDSLSQIAVPLFLMLSGALMLNEDKEVTIKRSLKYALNIFVLLCLWSVFYAVVSNFLMPLLRGQAISLNLPKFITDCLMGHHHMWYLYLIIGLYLVTPLLRLFVKKSNKKILLYLIVLILVFQFLPPFVDLISGNLFGIRIFSIYIDQFKVYYLSEYLIYYIAGWFVANITLSKKHHIAVYISGIAGFSLTFGLIELFIKKDPKVYDSLYSANSITIFCAALATFVFFFYLLKGKTFGKASGFVAYLSKLTFGVYLIHELFRSVLEEFLMPRIPNALVYIMVCFTLISVISFGTAFVMSKIPLVKKLIRC